MGFLNKVSDFREGQHIMVYKLDAQCSDIAQYSWMQRLWQEYPDVFHLVILQNVRDAR